MDKTSQFSSSFEFIWSQYRIWTATAKRLKRELTIARIAVLVFTLLGSFTAILSQNIAPGSGEVVSKILGWLSATSIAIVGYVGSKILTEEKEKKWLRARAAAETCKSNSFLYLFRVAPYNTTEDDVILFQKIETLIRTLSAIPQATLPTQEELKGIPPLTFTFANYLEERIRKQAKEYYFPKASQYIKYVKRGSQLGITLGLIGFLLGSYGASSSTNNISVWVAFVSTVSASLTTFLTTNRYQYLSMSFQAMGNQLMILWLKGSRIEKNDIQSQYDFIRNCEEILATENEAWLTEFNKTESKEETETTVAITPTQ